MTPNKKSKQKVNVEYLEMANDANNAAVDSVVDDDEINYDNVHAKLSAASRSREGTRNKPRSVDNNTLDSFLWGEASNASNDFASLPPPSLLSNSGILSAPQSAGDFGFVPTPNQSLMSTGHGSLNKTISRLKEIPKVNLYQNEVSTNSIQRNYEEIPPNASMSRMLQSSTHMGNEKKVGKFQSKLIRAMSAQGGKRKRGQSANTKVLSRAGSASEIMQNNSNNYARNYSLGR